MIPFLQDADCTLYHGDALDVLRELPDESVHCIATSPPFYALRDYGTGRWEGGDPDHEHERVGARGGRGGSGTLDKRSGDAFPSSVPVSECSCGARYVDHQVGLEETPDAWAAALVAVFREARRVLRKDGTLWVECGDSYASSPKGNPGGQGTLRRQGTRQHETAGAYDKSKILGVKPKDLIGSPFLLAFGLRDDGWWWRSTNIWHKPNCLPESVTDRPVVSHSYVFQFSKKARYFHDAEGVREPHESTRWGGKYSGPNAHQWKYADGAGNGKINERSERDHYPEGGRSLRSVWSIPTQGFSASGIGYDSPYTASADCPKHGLAADPESWQRAARGEPQDRRQYRIDGNDARRALEHASESGANSLHIPNPPSSGEPQTPQSTDESRTHDASLRLGDGLDDGDETLGRSSSTSDRDAPPADSSDSPRPERSDSATPHSTESRRTDPAPATTEPCTPSAQSPDRTGDTPASPELSEIASTPESRSAESVDSDVGPSVQTRSRTARKCTCEQDTIDHFATWPTKLAERILLMACPESVCRVCGKARERITSAEYTKHRPSGSKEPRTYRAPDGNWNSFGDNLRKHVTTEGFTDCGCLLSEGANVHVALARGDVTGSEAPAPSESKYRPGIVLDPFVGSGTTCFVARKLGRRSVGIDLNAEYLALAAKRLAQQSLLAVEA